MLYDHLLSLPYPIARIEKVIQQLVEQRLITVDKPQDAPIVVNLAHETLIQHWSLFHDWLQEFREDATRQRRLEEDAQAHSDGKKSLLTDLDLGNAEAYLKVHQERVPLTEKAVQFIQASIVAREQEAREREQQRREKERLQRRNWRVLAVSLVVAVVLGSFGWWQWGEAGKQRDVATEQKVVAQQQRDKALSGQSRFLADLATQQLEKGNSATAMRLALEALPGTSLDSPERPFVIEAQHQLYAAIERHWRGVWEHDSDVNYVEFSPDGKMLLTAAGLANKPFGSHAYLWEFPSGKLLQVFRGHTQAVNSASFSPDAKRVLTVSYDDTARLWDIKTGQLLRIFRNKHLSIGFRTTKIYVPPVVAFSPDGKYIAMVSVTLKTDINEDGIWGEHGIEHNNSDDVYLWDVESGQELPPIRLHYTVNNPRDKLVHDVRFSPDGTKLVLALDDGTARVWDLAKEQELRVLEHDGPQPKMIFAVFSPDGKQILTVHTTASIYATTAPTTTLYLWNVETGQQVAVLRGHNDILLRPPVFSPDGKKIATASDDKTARLWDASTGQELAVLTGHEGTVIQVAFSPDGRVIATASGDNTAKLWNAEGMFIHTLAGHQSTISYIAFSPDSKWLVTASTDKTTRLWNTSTGQQPFVIPDSRTYPVVNRDGTRIFASHENAKEGFLWSHDGQYLATCGREKRAIFNNNGDRLLVYSGFNLYSHLYNALNGQPLAELQGGVFHAQFRVVLKCG